MVVARCLGDFQMNALTLSEFTRLHIGQRVYAGGEFGIVEDIIIRNYHSWCAVINEVPYGPSEIATNVMEFPRMDTLPSEMDMEA